MPLRGTNRPTVPFTRTFPTPLCLWMSPWTRGGIRTDNVLCPRYPIRRAQLARAAFTLSLVTYGFKTLWSRGRVLCKRPREKAALYPPLLQCFCGSGPCYLRSWSIIPCEWPASIVRAGFSGTWLGASVVKCVRTWRAWCLLLTSTAPRSWL